MQDANVLLHPYSKKQKQKSQEKNSPCKIFWQLLLFSSILGVDLLQKNSTMKLEGERPDKMPADDAKASVPGGMTKHG
jgi:hypothetical protein